MHTITFSLDGEEVSTTDHQLSPNQIIKDLGGKDPNLHYLVELRGQHQENYKERGGIPIHVHNNQRFIIISAGPTPVSDILRTGTAPFAAGLRALGYTVNEEGAKVTFDYLVTSGKFQGSSVKLGFEVPADFPMTVPAGPHVSPMIHGGHSTGSAHPTSNIQASPQFGPGWEYWSRPFPGWQQEPRKTVDAYMAHVWRLWETQ